MIRHSIYASALAAITIAAFGFRTLSAAEPDPALIAQAKITQSDAQKIALEKEPKGRIISSELEQEHGALIWSFDLSKSGTENTTEVNVDAKTGKIVAVEIETPAARAKEARSDARESANK